jgi:hypothetical protein
MQNLEVGLFERNKHGHLRLIGVTCDQAVVDAACGRIADEHWNKFAQIEGSSPISGREFSDGGNRDGERSTNETRRPLGGQRGK